MNDEWRSFYLYFFFLHMSKYNTVKVVSYVGNKQALKMRFKFNYEINFTIMG